MKAEKLLTRTVLILTGVLVAQFGLRYILNKPGPTHVASWAMGPQSMTEAKELAEEIVFGRVTRVRRGEDLVIEVPGEPANEDRIPVEVVTIQVERRYKGGKGRPATIELFHTGLSKGTPPSERGDQPPGPPPEGATRPRQPPEKTATESRTIILADDPPYGQGERYVLLMVAGPTVNVEGRPVRTQRVISPEGRYLIRRDNRVEPASRRAAFAQEQRGRSLEALEALLRP